MNIKTRIKKYFTAKPKQNFWFHAFITLFLLKYVLPTSIMYWAIFQIGLLVPTAQIDFHQIAANIVDKSILPMGKFFELGQTIGLQHPFIAKVLFYGLSNIIWVIWIAAIALGLNLFRYFTSWCYRKWGKRKSAK